MQLLLLPEKDAVNCLKEEQNSATSKSIFDKLHDEQKVFAEKRKDRSKLRIDENLAECTFHPKISCGLTSRRSNEEFFAEMMKFKEVKEQRIKVQKKVAQEKEMEECRKSLSVSRTICGADAVHDRLFKQNIGNVKNEGKGNSGKSID